MPELPEVETFRQVFLHGTDEIPSLVGKRISGAALLWEKTLAAPTPCEFKIRISGQTICDLKRRGKYLLFQLSQDTLVIHLRMSGDLVVERQHEPVAPHHRLLIDLEGGLRLAFNDTRKFGRAWLVKDSETLLSNLGPEPLDPAFTAEGFYQMLQSVSRQLKPLLLDQHFIAGLGNIYTDEALHLAGLHPQTRSNRLSRSQVESLWKAVRTVLQEGILRNGSSIDWVYRGGDFQNYFQVFRRTGQACYRCGTAIQRIIVGSRSTHLCPHCQPLLD
jgi:formamidopyrimidine-DNA glycosylase